MWRVSGCLLCRIISACLHIYIQVYQGNGIAPKKARESNNKFLMYMPVLSSPLARSNVHHMLELEDIFTLYNLSLSSPQLFLDELRDLIIFCTWKFVPRIKKFEYDVPS